MSNRLENTATAVGAFTILAPLLALLMAGIGAFGWFVNGYVLAHIWKWYAVPLGAPVVTWLTFAAALMGKAIVAGLPVTPKPDKKQDGAEVFATLVVALAWPWVVLFVAWWLK